MIKKLMANAASRVLAFYAEAALPYEPYKPTKPKWQKKASQDRAGKPPSKPSPPEGTYTEDPGSIARNLKNNSKDFKQAVNRLTFYKNSSGDKLDSADKERLNRAKEQLYQSFGRDVPKEK